MSKEIITSVTTMVTKENFEKNLASWSPSSKKDSIRMIHFISLLTKHAKHLKNGCYAYLHDKYPDSQNAVDAESGLEVIKVTPQTKVYKKNEQTEAIELAIETKIAELKSLEAELKKLYEENGVDYIVDSSSYYKAK